MPTLSTQSWSQVRGTQALPQLAVALSVHVVPQLAVHVFPQTVATLAVQLASHVLQPLAAAHCVALSTHVDPQLDVQVFPQVVPTLVTQLDVHERVAQLSPLSGFALFVQVVPQLAVHVFPQTVPTRFLQVVDHFGDGQRSLTAHFVATRETHVESQVPVQQLGLLAQTAATQGSHVVASFAPVEQ